MLAIVVPVMAIHLLIGLPTYFAFMHSAQESMKTGDTEQFTKDVGNLSVDEAQGGIQSTMIFAVCGIIATILGLIGIKIKCT
jgi:hypothetical protein